MRVNQVVEVDARAGTGLMVAFEELAARRERVKRSEGGDGECKERVSWK